MVERTSSAGGKHGSNAKAASASQTASNTAENNTVGNTPSGLNESNGEFRVAENIIFGAANGNIKIRHSPQGDEVEVAPETLAGLMIDAFFKDKFDGAYPTAENK